MQVEAEVSVSRRFGGEIAVERSCAVPCSLDGAAEFSVAITVIARGPIVERL
jgi:hypothetical protein